MKIIIATDEGNFSRIFYATEKQEIIDFLKEFCGIDLKDNDEVPKNN